MAGDELVKRIRDELAARADPRVREGAQRFSREPVRVWGVSAPALQEIARQAYHEVKSWPPKTRDAWAEALWASGLLEEAAVAVYVYRRLAKQFGAREFRLFERWLGRYVDNWGSCDGLSSWLIAAAIEHAPESIPRLSVWARSRNRWKRRAAIVSLVQEARKGRHTAEILEVAELLIDDRDDLVEKGLGWTLKEAYPKRPREIAGFLQRAGARPSRLVLRIAAEKMSAQDRKAVLGPQNKSSSARPSPRG